MSTSQSLLGIFIQRSENRYGIIDVESHKKDGFWSTRVPMVDTEKDRGELLGAPALTSTFSYLLIDINLEINIASTSVPCQCGAAAPVCLQSKTLLVLQRFVQYEDPHGRLRFWESAERLSRHGDVDGVAIITLVSPSIGSRNWLTRFVVVGSLSNGYESFDQFKVFDLAVFT